MEFATVFTTCLALALASSDDYFLLPVPRDLPQTDVSELPVGVAHDFIRRFGFVKPSDDDILEYADTVGIDNIDVASGLRGLYNDPALILLEDDRHNTIGYYADSGVNLISAYPETRAVLRSLLDASNAVAIVYRPEKYLRPSEREAVATRFFSPANFKLRDVTPGITKNVPVVDAPVVFRKFEIPVFFPRKQGYHPLFDIDRIPYAYKAPVYLKQANTGFHSIDFDAKPVYPVVDTTYPVLYDSDSLKTESNTDRLTLSVPLNSYPPLPLVASENIPFTRPSSNNVLATDKFESERFRTTNIPTASNVNAPLIPPLLIRPEHLKAATVPVLSTATINPSASLPYVSNLISSITSPYVTRPETLHGAITPATNIPTTNAPTLSNVAAPITSPYVIRPETLHGAVAPILPTAMNVPTVSNVVSPVTPPYVIRGEQYNPATVPVLPAAQPTVAKPTISS